MASKTICAYGGNEVLRPVVDYFIETFRYYRFEDNGNELILLEDVSEPDLWYLRGLADGMIHEIVKNMRTK